MDYLTANGKERMLVFGLLLNLSCYCNSAAELINWICTKDGMEKEDLNLFSSPHSNQPINALQRVAKLEAEGERKQTESFKPAFYVTYRIDSRYIVKVHADTVEEAKQMAQSEWETADFGEAQDIDGEPVIVEDEDGNYVWEK